MHYAQATQDKPRPPFLARFTTEDKRDAFVSKDPTSRRPVDPPEDTHGFHLCFVQNPGSRYGENVEVRAIHPIINFSREVA